MRSGLVKGVVLASLASLVLVVDGGVAAAAPAYQLVAATDQGLPLPGATTSATASASGQFVAFAQQTGAGCETSDVWLRDRHPPKTVKVGTGVLPSITGDGAKVAFVSCAGPEVSFWEGTSPARALTSGQWRTGGADTIKNLVVSPGGGFVAFTTGPASGAPTALWVVPTVGSGAPARISSPSGALGDIALSDGTLFFIAGDRLYSTPADKAATPTLFAHQPDGAVAAVATSSDGHTVAMATGDSNVYVSVQSKPPVLVTGGALEPSVAPDGSAVAVTMGNSSLKTFTTADPPAVISTASPVSALGFRAPIVSNGGREIVFLANPGSAAGGTSANVQVFALGPSLTSTATDLGQVGVGATTTKAVTFTNEGTVAITPQSVSSSNAGEFALAATGTTCVTGQPIPVAKSCVVQVALTPRAAGARASTLTIVAQDTSWDALVVTANLTATAVNGELSADPTSLDFGSVTIGGTSSARSFTVTNSGTLPTTIGTLLVSGGEASEFPLAGGTCAGAKLAPAGQCTVSMSFKPGGIGQRRASMDVGGSTGAVVSVALSGTGANPPRPALAASPTTLDFGELIIGSEAALQSVTVRNSGNVTNNASVQIDGPGAADFVTTTNGCAGRSIAAGASCTVSVGFNPTVAGARVATLSVTGTGGSSASVRLSGTGRLNPVIAVSPAVIVPGQIATVVGTNFPAGTAVAMAWGVGGPAVTAVADDTGSFRVAVVVPSGVGGGTRRLVVTAPPEAATATAAVLVQETGGFQGPGGPAFRNSPAFRP